MELERVTTEAVRARVAADGPAVLLVPVGSCEQHGPHLPFDTDTRIARAVAIEVARRAAGVVVAPAVAFGSSGEHQSFPGTLSIGSDALVTVLLEIGRSALPDPTSPTAAPGPFGAVVFVNGHGGNLGAVGVAVERLAAESRVVASWSPRIPDGDAHAGRTETSLLLAVAPDAVGEARPVGNTEPIADLVAAMRVGGIAAVAPDGVLGDASGATAVHGREVFDALVCDLAVTVDTIGQTVWKRA